MKTAAITNVRRRHNSSLACLPGIIKEPSETDRTCVFVCVCTCACNTTWTLMCLHGSAGSPMRLPIACAMHVSTTVIMPVCSFYSSKVMCGARGGTRGPYPH